MKSLKYIKLDLVFGLLVLLYFFWIFFKYSVNIPINDDYDVIDNFNNIINANTFTEKVKLFFRQHNEHRILYDKLWFYITYYFNPYGLNFNFLSFIGNLSLVFILAFYFLNLKEKFKGYFILFPLSVLIMNLAFWENLTFSMATLSNLTFMLFAILSIYYITVKESNNKYLFISLLFFFLSIFTQGGGLFVFPVALLIFIIKKDKVSALKFLLLSGLIIFIYFFDYHKHPSPSIKEIIENSFSHIKFFFAFLGNAVSNYHFFPDNNEIAVTRSIFFGIFLFAFYCFLLIKRYYNKNLFNFSIMTFVIIISSVTAISRLSQGLSTSISSRYRLTSIIFIVSIFIYLLEILKDKNIKKQYVNLGILVFSCLYLFLYNFNSTNEFLMSTRKKSLLIGILHNNSNDNKLINGFNKELCAKTLLDAKESKTYILNQDLINNYYKFADIINLNKIIDDYTISGVSYVDRLSNLDDSFYLDGFAFIDNYDTKNQKVFISLLNNGKERIFNTYPEDKPGLSDYFKKPKLDYGGFYLRLNKKDVLQGTNEISVIVCNENKYKVFKSDKNIIKE